MSKGEDLHWSTSITSVKPNEIRLRGYRIDELMGSCRFSEVVYLALRGELPSKSVGEVIEAILVSSIDHSATPPSALATRTAASTGAPINAAVCAGLLSINAFHGGAIEDAMKFFYSAVERARALEGDLEDRALAFARELKEARQRASGYGHRIHNDDPRTARLFEIAGKNGCLGEHCRFALAFKNALYQTTGKDLPLNVDGAIAAVLCDLGFSSEIANAFFMMARLPGLVAHYFEEKSREKVMRKIHPTDFDYDGPQPRQLPKE
ncbi:MAG: citryl-CoA lyase [Planctomycetota bacterium]